MSLTIKDGLGVSQTLATGLSGSDLVPFHGISGSVTVTAPKTDPVFITGSVAVSASQQNPVYVVGTVTATSNVYNAPNSALYVTSSTTSPVWVSSSTTNPLWVTSSAVYPLAVTSSGPVEVRLEPLYIDNGRLRITGSVVADLQSLVHVTASMTSPVAVTGTVMLASTVNVTSNNSSPVVIKTKAGVTVTRSTFTPYGAIDYTSSASGTFEFCDEDANRIGLMISNPSQKNLYISVGDNGQYTTNGFTLNSVSQEPQSFSFILYPSGTYFAESGFVSMKHGGFFVSSSNILDQAIARSEVIL